MSWQHCATFTSAEHWHAEDSDSETDSGEDEMDKTKKAPPYGRGLI